MPSVQEESTTPVGSFHFEVFGSGRHGRRRASRFTLRCDAIGLHCNEILLLSLVGPETSVKALTAGLRASNKDQQRVGYSAHVGNVGKSTCPDALKDTASTGPSWSTGCGTLCVWRRR